MAFTARVFGRKVTTLRTDLGQDLATLALSSGLAEHRLARLEAGEDDPTGDELLILADRLKRDFRFFLDDEAADPEKGIELLFRERGGELPPADRLAIAEFISLCRNQALLERNLGSTPTQPGFRFRAKGGFYKGEGSRCAQELRRHLGLGADEVVRDVFASMRAMGFKVFRRRLENSYISGLFVNHPEAGPCVLVNLSEGMTRQRFSAAHEWGHGLMDEQPVVLSMVGEWSSRELVEVRANTFASEFLIPPARLADAAADWSNPQVVHDWAVRFRVSVPALLAALVAAKHISSEQREVLRGAVRRTPEPPDPELEGDLSPMQANRKRHLLERGLSKSYVDLCFQAYDHGEISFGLLCDVLLTSAAGLYEVAELFGQTIHRG